MKILLKYLWYIFVKAALPIMIAIIGLAIGILPLFLLNYILG